MAFDVNALPLSKKFSRRLVAPDTYSINPFDPEIATPTPYVLEGDDYALVIDTTYTSFPLREYIETYVTDKPLKVACSHGHFDHTNDNGQFNDCEIFMSEFAWNEIKARREQGEAGRWVVYDNESNAIALTPEQIGDYTPTILKPGDKIDLGNRVIEVLPYVGIHSPGSLIYLDHKTGVLFTGDEIECGQMLVMGRMNPAASIEQLKENIQTLIDGWGDKVTAVCPPHNGAPFSPLFLGYLVEACDRIMSGVDGEMNVGSMSYLLNPKETRPAEMIQAQLDDPDILRMEWKGTSIVYNKKKIFKEK